MKIRYARSLEDISPAHLDGFFRSWKSRPSSHTILSILRGSGHVVLAFDDENGSVPGLINAITDGTHFAFIPLLEVVPEYRGRGIGSELVRRMLAELREYPCIDLTCDPGIQSFYERCGMARSTGMVIRDYTKTALS